MTASEVYFGQTDAEEWRDAIALARQHRNEPRATVTISTRGLAAAADRLEADAQLGAALRAALATLAHGAELQVFAYRPTTRAREYQVCVEEYQGPSYENAATRSLAEVIAAQSETRP